MVLKVGYVLTDERETSGTPRFRFYNPKKYFSKDVYAEIYKPSEKYDVVVFTKRFTNGDIELAKKLDCVKIFDINDNFFELSQYVTKDELNNCIMMASICDAVITPSRYIRDQAQKYNSKSIWIPDFIDDVEETNLVLSWHGLASNVNQLLQHIVLGIFMLISFVHLFYH